MSDQPSKSTSPVLVTAAVTDVVATAVGREPIAFEQLARDDADAFGLSASVP